MIDPPHLLLALIYGACCLLGAVLFVAAVLGKNIIRLPEKHQHLSRPIHLLSGLCFFGFPMMALAQHWAATGTYLGLAIVAVLYTCVVDQRYGG